MSEKILEVDRLNPQVAARLAGAFDVWTKLPKANQVKVEIELKRMLEKGLSRNTHEIVKKALDAGANLS